jgi:hypothetical protein
MLQHVADNLLDAAAAAAAAAAGRVDGTAQGVLLLNSNGMDILLNKTSVTFRYSSNCCTRCFTTFASHT